MVKYQKYAEYKDSGIEWLGDIPSHWGVTRLKWCLTNNDGGVWGDDPQGFDDTIVLRSTEQTVDGHWKINDPAIRKLNKYEKASALLVAEDLLLTKSSGSTLHIGKTTLVTKEVSDLVCCYSNFMQRLRVNKKLSAKLVWYLLNNNLARTQFEYLSNTTTGLANLNSSIIGEIILPLAVIEEQTQIANFLDHETAKIDSLIEKQQLLIQLLKEKRQAVISHAVTKGLDPSVKMKDSGVEWLGQVPEHWKICSLSKIFAIKAGGDVQISLFSEIQTDEHKFPIYTNANNANSIYGYSKIANYSANSITVSGRGDVGFAVYRDHAFDAIIRLLVLTPQKTCYTKYYAYFINEVIDFKVESSAIGQLSTLQISPYNILFPPFEEQKLITEYLDNETIKIDTLIHKAESVIQLMQERRTALISAAVTGKIDVRNWQNPTEAKMEFSA